MKIVIHIISALVAVAAIFWLYAEPGYEPLITSLVSLAALAGIGLSDQLRKQPSFNIDQNKYEFIKELGIYEDKKSRILFCTSCLSKGTVSPLKEVTQGWQCQVKKCSKFYPNKDYRLKQRRGRIISRGIELPNYHLS